MVNRTLKTALVGLVIFITFAQVVFTQEANQDSDASAYWEYDYRKVDPWGPFVLNLLLPFGVGSFVQGDTTGGLIVAGGQVVGIGLVVASTSSGDPLWPLGTMTYVGVGLYFVASVAGYVFPFTYANAANDKLRKDLGISVSDVSLSEQGLAVTFAVEP